MRSNISQRMVERAVRAAIKAGLPPTRTECHPDGTIILCFGDSKVSVEDGLDHEMEQWRRKHATN
jgi:hypothetical protein